METGRILVIEDDAVVAKDLQNRLDHLGHHVVGLASSGKGAIEQAERHRPDLVLMDIVLKGEMDGIEAAQEIRKRFAIPVVYLTAFSEQATIDRAKATQPHGYLLKPFDDRDLSITLEMALYKDRMERALRESEQKYRGMVQSSPDHIFLLTVDGIYMESNDCVDHFGLNDGRSLIGRHLSDAYPDAIIEEYESNFRRVLETRKPVSFEHEISANGSVRHHIDTLYPVLIDDELRAVGGLCRDITERVEAERALAAEKEQLSVTLRSIGDGVISTDAAGNIVLINQVTEGLTGWTQAEAIGSPLQDVFHIINEKTREPCENPVQKVIESGQIVGLANDTVLVARDGTERIIADSGAPIWDGNGRLIGVVLVFRDITEQLRLEAQLMQAQKVEALGTLAGGIAHDFNNILGIIIGNTELAIDDVPDWNPAKECLLEVRAAAFRGRDVVKQILSFSRPSQVEQSVIPVTPILDDTIRLLRASTPSTIDIQKRVECARDTVLGDPTQINQVLVNLCTNASQAMADNGGVLEVALEVVEIDTDTSRRFQNLDAGSHLRIAVSDNGSGIDPDHVDQIFDPFFTTKPIGQGEGLGLSVVHGIVASHAGEITVESKPGRGTTFHVYIPLIDENAIEEEEDGETLPSGDEAVLLIDDEPALARAYSLSLKMLGYKVTTSTNPNEALGMIRRDPERFDLVLTDMTMPHMTGDRLAQAILGIRKDLPVILCTGYNQRISEDKAAGLGIGAYLMKPISKGRLARTVREVLDSVGSEPPVGSRQ